MFSIAERQAKDREGTTLKKLYGVITAMTTPFDKEGNVDVQALERAVDFQIEKGVNCLYPCGTTGEMFLMTAEQRKLVAETVVRKAAGRVTVYIHCGAMDPCEVVELANHAHDIGADGVGIVTPTYFSLDSRMMIEYYRGICEKLPKGFPVYVYVIPQLAHNDIDGATMQKIADACPDNVIGVKYSFADMRRMVDYCEVNGGTFSVVFGPDDLFLPALSMGADGTVSGCAGCIPEPFVEVYRCWKAGDLEGAKKAQFTCFDLVKKLHYGADMSIFKHVLDDRGVGGGHAKAPLLDLADETVEPLLETLRPYYKK